MTQHKTQPNIIFIVADDLGYADLGCYGGRGFDGDGTYEKGESVSPELDKLAVNGMLFTDGYSNSPVCSPTRFAMITARYQYRLRGAAEEPIASKARGSLTLGLPPEHPTLPSMLRDAGYNTALVGKWHLGFEPNFGPLKSGYQEFFGPISGGVDYFTHCDSRGVHDLWQSEKGLGSGKVVEHFETGYLTDLFTERALDYIERQNDSESPFFMSLHYTAPHWPWETRDDAALAEEIKDNIFHLHGGNIHSYRRMIHHMDEGIGRIAALLKAQGKLDNTLIVFTSDNGGERFSDNWPLVGGKMDLTEGGIRVPYIAHWPAVIKAGQVSSQQCITMDWSTTMLAAAGIALDTGIASQYPLDGASLLPALRDASQTKQRRLFWRMNHRGQRAMRDGKYKYLRVDGNDYVFDLTLDARERANLGKHHPELLEQMRSAWEAWNATMPAIPEDATVSLGYDKTDMPQR
jgi:arylsulfatase A-like enzyme